MVSLLGAVGEVEEEHNGKLKITLGPETEVIHPPRGKDVDKGLVADLRRMLGEAGFDRRDGSPGVAGRAGPRLRRLSLGTPPARGPRIPPAASAACHST